MTDLDVPFEQARAMRQFMLARFMSAKESGGVIGCGCHNPTVRGAGPDERWCATHEAAHARILGGAW